MTTEADLSFANGPDEESFAAETLDDIDFDYAVAVAVQARELMTRHAIPPTPNNYRVWFQYALATAPEFNKAVDLVVASARRFDSATNRELYLACVSAQTGGPSNIEVSKRLQKALTSAKGLLSSAISDNRAHVESLGGIASRMDSSTDAQKVIEDLVAELSSVVMRATTLETHFAQNSHELDEIRESLDKAEQRAKTDALTGLANRHALDEMLRSAQGLALHRGEPMSILLLDIDHFKRFNDNFGHLIGDQVIRLVAKVLQDNIRVSDMAARYGGEELIAVLPATDRNVAHEIAERIRQSIAQRTLVRRTSGERLSNVSVSIGVAQYLPGESISTLVDRCDSALYLAKREGRNRTKTELDLDRAIVAA